MREPGSMVLAVLGSVDSESIGDIVGKGEVLLTFDTVSVLEVDLRAATTIEDDAAGELAGLVRSARRSGRELRFRSVPTHLHDTVEGIVRAAAP